jgi:hypothetical protein
MTRKTATAVATTFDIDAYLASKSEPRQSMLSYLGSKLDGAVQRSSKTAGSLSESFSNVPDAFELGRKVGAVRSGARIERMRQEAKAEIEAILAATAR